LNAFIESDDYLSTRRGKYAQRNEVRLPWENHFDLKVVQEFKIEIAGLQNRFQLSLDIMNVGNLLNKDWGHQNYLSNQEFALIDFKGNVANTKQPQFTYTGANLVNGKPYSVSDLGSRWRAQVGLRYYF